MPAISTSTTFSVLGLFPRAENALLSANSRGMASCGFSQESLYQWEQEAQLTARFVVFAGRNYSSLAMEALRHRKPLRLGPCMRFDRVLMQNATQARSSVLVALIDPDMGDLEHNVRVASFYDPDIVIFGRPRDQGRIADVAARADRFVAAGNLVVWVG